MIRAMAPRMIPATTTISEKEAAAGETKGGESEREVAEKKKERKRDVEGEGESDKEIRKGREKLSKKKTIIKKIILTNTSAD